MPREKLVCSCNKTMPLDGKALGAALRHGGAVVVHTELCRRHLAAFESAVKSGNDLVVACTQEAPLFGELQEELKGDADIRYVNIRENAGWSTESSRAMPKVAALLAMADLPGPEPVPVVNYRSGGQLLIIGPAGAALEWAERLHEQLSVSVLLTGAREGAELPIERKYPVYSGTPRRVEGYLGAFVIEWDQENPIDLDVCTRCNACIRACPEQAIDFTYQIDLAKCKAHRQCVTVCGEIRAVDFERKETRRSESYDLVLDLGREPLIRSPQPPQGYFAPGGDPVAQADAARALVPMVGEFEKPRFFRYREKICAHSRNEIVGCTKCIEVCSTRAISSEREESRIKVEPHLCMGCGGCATVCPSGAMGYAYPGVADLGLRIRTALQVYRNAGGEHACLLLHNPGDGRSAVGRMARRGKGLPARVIPLEVFHVASIGIDLALGAVALGAEQVVVLAAGSEAPGYAEAMRQQLTFAQEILAGLGYGTGHFHLVESGDTARIEQAVWGLPQSRGPSPAAFNLSNEKRATLDFVLDHLLRNAPHRVDAIPLPPGAPFGRVEVDRAKCTMCLACVGACPEGALLDTKDKPQLRFIERNCVQCGLCEKTCPEDAISLAPRLLLAEAATRGVVVNEDKVQACARCGKPFANQRIVENMVARLSAHSMFRDPAALRRLQMCQDCRVADLVEGGGDGTIFDHTRRE